MGTFQNISKKKLPNLSHATGERVGGEGGRGESNYLLSLKFIKIETVRVACQIGLF